MRKGVALQEAASDIESALAYLEWAKKYLRQTGNDQFVRLSMKIEELKEIRDILKDPECTPEILDREEAE